MLNNGNSFFYQIALYTNMSTFKEFMEDVHGFGYNTLGKGKNATVHDGTPYVRTSDLTGYRNSLPGARRRQLIDIDEPGQKYYYYITLVRTLIADVDTGKLIAGHKDHVYKVVYTPNEMTKIGYAPEEHKRIQELGIFLKTKGYDHKQLLHVIGSNDIDQIEKFQKGELFDPATIDGFAPKTGWYVDYENLSEVRDKMDKWMRIQGTVERGIHHIGGNLGAMIQKGASMNRIAPSPSATFS